MEEQEPIRLELKSLDELKRELYEEIRNMGLLLQEIKAMLAEASG